MSPSYCIGEGRFGQMDHAWVTKTSLQELRLQSKRRHPKIVGSEIEQQPLVTRRPERGLAAGELVAIENEPSRG